MDEGRRLKALNRYAILDTPPEAAFDEIASLAMQLCHTSIAIVSFMAEDRAWFKSIVGLELREVPRELSFCQFAVNSAEIVVVPDATLDPRFSKNPFVVGTPHVRFYASSPLITPDGFVVGTISVLSTETRELTFAQKQALERLGRIVVQVLEARLSETSQRELAESLALLNAVAIAANSAVDSKQVLNQTMSEILRYSHSSIGHYLLPEMVDEKIRLRSSHIWHFRDFLQSEKFVEKTNSLESLEGSTMPSEVLATRRPAWVSVISETSELARTVVCREIGLISGFAFPVIFNGELVGVFEFFSTKKSEPSKNLIQVLEQVGTLVAQALERIRSEEALEKQREFQNAVLESLSDGVVACDAEGRLTLFNRASREFHGIDADDRVPMHEWPIRYSLYDQEGTRKFETSEIPLVRSLNGESIRNFGMSIIRENGERRSLLASGQPILTRDGRRLGAVATMRDITKEAETQVRLGATTQALESLIETAPIGISLMDRDLKLTIWNGGCEKIYGWKKEEVLGGHLPFYSDEDKLAASKIIERVLATRVRVEVQEERARKDGTIAMLRISVIPIMDGKGGVSGYMGVVVDISDLKQKEDDLLEINRALRETARAKSDFLANMSHEIRTPLNGVIGMAELLSDTTLDRVQAEYVGAIESSGANLLAIVTDILDFSKIEAGRIELETIPFDLHRLLTDTCRTFSPKAVEKSIRLHQAIRPSDPSQFVGDPGRIQQILMNLVSNAIKFTSQGEVEIGVKVEEIQGKTASVRFEISDSGIGITKEAIGKLFQAFTQADSSTNRKYGGTGLGLSISKRLVEVMGGKIGVDSEIGRGSKFWFEIRLPMSNAISDTLAEYKKTRTALFESLGPLRILVAEDNPVNQKIAITILQGLGLNPVAVSNGIEALEELQRREFDLILMDCQMPEMDGYQATQLIRADTSLQYNRIPIIAVTANAMKGDAEICAAAGMDGYLSKPYRQEDLFQVIETVMAIPLKKMKS